MKTSKYKQIMELRVVAVTWQHQRRPLPEAKQFADEAILLAGEIENGKGVHPGPRIAGTLDRWRLAILAGYEGEFGTAKGKRVAALLSEIRTLENATIGTPDRVTDPAPTVPDSEVI